VTRGHRPESISVIIPTWNDGRQAAATLKRLRAVTPSEAVEFIVVDGGSRDETVGAAKHYADRVIPLGGVNRGAQLHRGAMAAKGDLLFFVYPDSQAPANWSDHLLRFWRSNRASGVAATVFTVDYGRRFGMRLAALGQNLRASWRHLACGNAGICTTRSRYKKSGGFPEIPFMDDRVFTDRLRRQGKVVRLTPRIRPSARLLRTAGPLRYLIQDAMMRGRFALGESPESLWRRYGSRRINEVPGVTDGEEVLKAALRYGERRR